MWSTICLWIGRLRHLHPPGKIDVCKQSKSCAATNNRVLPKLLPKGSCPSTDCMNSRVLSVVDPLFGMLQQPWPSHRTSHVNASVRPYLIWQTILMQHLGWPKLCCWQCLTLTGHWTDHTYASSSLPFAWYIILTWLGASLVVLWSVWEKCKRVITDWNQVTAVCSQQRRDPQGAHCIMPCKPNNSLAIKVPDTMLALQWSLELNVLLWSNPSTTRNNADSYLMLTMGQCRVFRMYVSIWPTLNPFRTVV